MHWGAQHTHDRVEGLPQLHYWVSPTVTTWPTDTYCRPPWLNNSNTSNKNKHYSGAHCQKTAGKAQSGLPIATKNIYTLGKRIIGGRKRPNLHCICLDFGQNTCARTAVKGNSGCLLWIPRRKPPTYMNVSGLFVCTRQEIWISQQSAVHIRTPRRNFQLIQPFFHTE